MAAIGCPTAYPQRISKRMPNQSVAPETTYHKRSIIMDKDRVEGKVKDVAGRVERQVGEWTGNADQQAHGTAKQVEGKVQNTWGKVKDAARSTKEQAHDSATTDEAADRELESDRKAS